MAVVIMVMLALAAVHRLDGDRAGQVGAEHRHQVEFPILFHAGFLGEIVAQVPFGQQIGKKRWQTAADRAHRRDEAARTAFVRQAQGRARRKLRTPDASEAVPT